MPVFDLAKRIIGGEELSFLGDRRAAFVCQDTNAYILLPGFCDVHVHFREPGFSYKESIASGARAAAHGGYTAVCTMPNLNPVPDSVAHLRAQQELIDRDACIAVYPYAAISVGERGEQLSDMEALAAAGAIAFSDDGQGVQDAGLMREAMQRAKALGKLIAAQCEDRSLLHGGYVHDGVYAAAHGHRGICSKSEWIQLERDLSLVEQTGCAYHVCHVSTKESIRLIREAKRAGLDVSCETAPHYLLLDENDLQEDGRFKMNPPLRAREDREALLEGLFDGTIDMIATDHAPHSAEEKARGLAGSAFGIVGLETAFPLLYTGLVLPGHVSLETLADKLSAAPRRRFGIPAGRDCAIWDFNARYTIDPRDFLSLGRATPFAGTAVHGRCLLTVHGENIVYEENLIG